MNINSKINWKPGLELTSKTFTSFDAQTEARQQATARAILSDGRVGRFPNMEFCSNGVFVRNTFQIDRLRLTAYLPSGKILDIDEAVTVKVPMLYGSCYYLAAGFGEGSVEFESDGVPMRRPAYSYEILPIEELEHSDKMPVVRFIVKEGTFSLSPDYIAPCLTLGADDRFSAYIEQIVYRIEKLITHANMEEGEGHRLMIRYLFLLKGCHTRTTVHDFLLFLQEIAQAVDYYIVKPHTVSQELLQPSIYDIQIWLEWFSGYMDGAASILDNVVIEDHSIDFEALKAQVKAELYEKLNPELYKKLIDDLKEQLTKDITQHVKELLSEYLNQVAIPTIYKSLTSDLQKQLYDNLYQPLYDALYNALYVPEEAEEEHIPII